MKVGNWGSSALFGTLAALACVPASAPAASLPRWLKPPYEHYTLTYEATDSSHGSIETSAVNPPSGACESVTGQFQGSQALHAVVRYAFVFGRNRGKVAFVYKLAGRSATGRVAMTDREGYPGGCPAGGRFPEGPQTAECAQPIGFDDPPELEVGASVAETRFGLSLAVSVNPLNEPTCTGSPQVSGNIHPASFDWGAEKGEAPLPGTATMTFTASGIEARRTFHGKVTTDPRNAARSGGGTQPQSNGEQVVWSFADSPSYSLTLAPAGRG
jgi:hypothetical protein